MAVLTRKQFGDLYNSIKLFSTTTAQHPRAYNARIAAAEQVAKSHQKAGFDVPARLWSQLAEDLKSEKMLYRLGSQVVGEEIPEVVVAAEDAPYALPDDQPEPEDSEMRPPRSRRSRERVGVE